MKLEKIINVPEARLSFTMEDVVALEAAAARHYDGRCRRETGIIVGMLRNQLSHSKTAELCLQQFQVDILGKTCEQGQCGTGAYALLAEFHNILNAMNKSFHDHNEFDETER